MNNLPLSTYELHSISLVKKTFLATTFLLLFAFFCKGGVSSPGPLNDNCDTAMELTLGETHTQSLCGASLATRQPSALDLDIYDVWFKITMDNADALHFTIDNLNNEAFGISVYQEDDCSNEDTDDFGGPFDNITGLAFHTTFELSAGMVFYVQIWSTFESTADIVVGAESNILGCTEYCNIDYNPLATLDDGTCSYAHEHLMRCYNAEVLSYDAFFPVVKLLSAEMIFSCYTPNSPNAESSPVNGGVYYTFEGNGLQTKITTCDNYGVTEFHVYKQMGDCEDEVDYIGRSVSSNQECTQESTNPQEVLFLSEEGATYLLYVSTWDDDGIEYIDHNAEVSIRLISIAAGDFNFDGSVGSDDLLFFLSYFTCIGSGCEGDFNNDGLVNTIDLLEILSNFNDQ